ncbi:cytochrome P450 3A11-like [Liolophura sinensis]|uniref:cytochrome P450 3A11-like n=1 Tax=Liolophura sinensis TaxID=3198878 RepID=UPI00315890E0
MRSHDVPPVTQFLTIIADDDWKHNRNSLTPAFTSGKLKKMTDSICKAAESFVEALKEKADKHEPMDVKQFTSGYTMEVIAATSFGMKLDAQKADDDPFVKYAMKFFKVSVTNPFVLASFVCPFVLPIMKLLKISAMPTDSIDFFKKIVDQALEQRRSNPGKYNDFLQLMITAENQARSAETQSHDDDGLKGGEVQQSNWKDKRMGQGLSDSEILAQCITFFVAGFDTSAATIAYALYHLTMNPECQQKLVDEIDDYYPGGKVPDYDELPEMPYLNMVINETLRMNPPAARVDRMCTRDTVVRGLHIPAGMPVAIPIYNIHRDPEYWDEPDTFNPERFSPENRASHHPLQWIPFGHGPRNCIGMRLALLEIRIALVYLFQKYRFVPNSKTLPLRFGESLFLTNPKDGIWVTPQHRD